MLAERDAALADEGHGRDGGTFQAAGYGEQRRADNMVDMLVGEITDSKTPGDDHYSKLQNISIHPRAVAHVGAKVDALKYANEVLNDADVLAKQATAFMKKGGKAASKAGSAVGGGAGDR